MWFKARACTIEPISKVKAHHTDHWYFNPDAGAGTSIKIIYVDITVRSKRVTSIKEKNEREALREFHLQFNVINQNGIAADDPSVLDW